MPWCFATNQKFPLSLLLWSSSHRPALLEILSCSSLPQQAFFSDKFSLGYNSSCQVPPSLWSWLLGCEVFCPPESELLSSSSDSTKTSPSWAVPSRPAGSMKRAGCEHTWPQRHKLSLFTPTRLQIASNSWIHPAYNLKAHFLQRKSKLQKEKCLYLKPSLCYVLGVEKNPQARWQKHTVHYFDYSCSNWIFLQNWNNY